MKTNKLKKHNTENQKDEQHVPHQKNRGEPRSSQMVSSSCFLQETHSAIYSQVCKSLVSDWGKKKLVVKGKRSITIRGMVPNDQSVHDGMATLRNGS